MKFSIGKRMAIASPYRLGGVKLRKSYFAAEGARVSRISGWFRVTTCRALMRLAHGSSTLYFIDFSTSV
jgi:hypothetical protein